MLMKRCVYVAVAVAIAISMAVALTGSMVGAFPSRLPHRILLDTDFITDDFFALLYLLKLNRSEFDLQAVTINSNSWMDAGHAVNQIYDILYMMDRDDIAVGVGGEGDIREDGSIEPDVGGYLPIIEQGVGTAGYCRYRQAIPVGEGGRLHYGTNFGIRRSFLPQGSRKYSPLRQPTAQQVIIDKVSAGPITVFLIGAHTNLAIFLMNNPHLKKNVEHIFIMGGGVRSSNPTGCCPQNSTSSCQPEQCGDRGNLFTAYTHNPYAEFNIFLDPFAAYQVIHSGIPVTLVPLDATNTIPITPEFFKAFEDNQHTYEAQYCFKSLKMTRDTWFDDYYFDSYFMWDSFTSGIATSIMRSSKNHNEENEFAEMETMNITVITSNKPYGTSDGSNPFFDGLKVPKFNLKRDGVHSGHVQTGVSDPFCLDKNGKGRCMDGYTEERTDSDSRSVFVATRAKPNKDSSSPLNREFFKRFLDVLNSPEQSGRFNFTNQFPCYKEVLYTPDFSGKKLGKDLVFDMDMSAGDFLALFYLLKLPMEVINLKAIIVTATGWANAATIDVVYDLLHMMGRDDIPVGLGEVFAMEQSDCKYSKVIPIGSGGFLDSDTLYGFARIQQRIQWDTDHPELRQPLAMEIWDSIVKSLDPGSKVSILTNGPLTSLAKMVLLDKNICSHVEDVFIVGGHINYDNKENGNLINVPSNDYAEFNMFLDPLAAKTVFKSGLNITLIPLSIQRKVSAFQKTLERLQLVNNTPEVLFSHRLLSRLHRLQQAHHRYRHVDIFLGEILGAVILGGDHSVLNSSFKVEPVEIIATGIESEDGQMIIDGREGILVRILENLDAMAFPDLYAMRLGDKEQSAVVGSFDEQKRSWSLPSCGEVVII